MTRSELIAALRDAMGPDRKLDVEIMKLLGVSNQTQLSFSRWRACKARGDETATLDNFLIMIAPKSTGSLDVAFKLLPTGWSCETIISEQHKHPCVTLGRSHPTNATVAVEGNTLPLALCIAALEAMG